MEDISDLRKFMISINTMLLVIFNSIALLVLPFNCFLINIFNSEKLNYNITRYGVSDKFNYLFEYIGVAERINFVVIIVLCLFIFTLMTGIFLIRENTYRGFKHVGLSFLIAFLALFILFYVIDSNNLFLNDIRAYIELFGYIYLSIGLIFILCNIIIKLLYDRKENKYFNKM